MKAKQEMSRTTLYLPLQTIKKLKMEAAIKGVMHYSSSIENSVLSFIKENESIKSYDEIKNKYKEVTNSFVPSRVGRPWNKDSTTVKKALTVYLFPLSFKKMQKFAEKLTLSVSSMVELALLIADNNESNDSKIPLYLSDPRLKFIEQDYVLLKKLMIDSGAEYISEFLAACSYTWIMKEIKKIISDNKRMSLQ